MAFKKKNRKVEEVKEEVTTPVVTEDEAKEEKKEEVPYYVISKVYNPNEENTTLEIPHGYVYFKDEIANQRLDALESKLIQMCAFFLGIDLNKKEEKTEEKTETQE